MRKNKILFAVVFVSLSLMGAGCFGGNQDAGVLRSLDGAQTFENKSAIAGTGTLASRNILRVVFNPSNTKQIIVGTQGGGFYLTENQGEVWQNVAFASGNGNAIAIDPKDQNILYLALDAKIYKSQDGGKNFKQVYTEQTGAVQDVVIDPTDSTHIFALTSSGNFLVSKDGGETWKANAFIVGSPYRLKVDPKNVNHIFVATQQNGVYVSSDGGASFNNNAFVKLRNTSNNNTANLMAANDISIDPFDTKIILVATNHGLVESTDAGASFRLIPTLIIPETAPLRSVQFHPTIKDAVFLSAKNKFYTSTDLAVTWSVVELPTEREVYDIAVNPTNSNELYLAIKGIKSTRPIDLIGFGAKTK